MVLAALPLIRGQAIDTQLEFKRIPTAWRQAGQGLDRTLPRNTRALVLPGQIFAYYKWGGTLDAILPRLTSRPVAVRYETPYSDLHAVDLLTTVDDLVQQRRLVPGQLSPLLALMGVGAVVTGTDDDISRSGAIDPAAAAGVLTAAAGAHAVEPLRPGSQPAAGGRRRGTARWRCPRCAATTSRAAGGSCTSTRRRPDDRRRRRPGARRSGRLRRPAVPQPALLRRRPHRRAPCARRRRVARTS